MAAAEPSVAVRNLAGRLLAEVSPVPETVGALKAELAERLETPPALQRLVGSGSAQVCADEDKLSPEGGEFMMVVDETPMCTWDHAGNLARSMLVVDGGVVTCPGLVTDFVNVLTREPVRRGAHYFEFHMHYIGDEQWCGLVANPAQAGRFVSGRRLEAWTYYAGRMRSNSDNIVDGQAALHALGKAVVPFKKPGREGSVIGMLVDVGKGAVAFSLNGELQGACAIPTDKPLWVMTHVDTDRDHVELRKPSLKDAPPSNLEALTGALIEVTAGESLSYHPFGGHHFDSDTDEDQEDETDDEAAHDSCGE